MAITLMWQRARDRFVKAAKARIALDKAERRREREGKPPLLNHSDEEKRMEAWTVLREYDIAVDLVGPKFLLEAVEFYMEHKGKKI